MDEKSSINSNEQDQKYNKKCGNSSKCENCAEKELQHSSSYSDP